MKKLIYLLIVISIMSFGCEANIEPKASDNNSNWSYNNYHIVIIDNCQYIYLGRGNTQSLTHKGNCNNPIHQYKE